MNQTNQQTNKQTNTKKSIFRARSARPATVNKYDGNNLYKEGRLKGQLKQRIH